MPLSDHVNVSISIQASSLRLPGFGTPLILATPGSQPSGFTDRRRIYTEAEQLLDDAWSSSSSVYLQALAAFSQRPRVRQVMVGRRDAAVAHVWTVAITAGTNGTYTITINGTAVTHVASGQTAAQISAALRTLLASHPDVTGGFISVTGSDPNIILTALTAGIPIVASVSGPAITLTETTPNHGIPEDLVLINEADPDWYGLLIPEQDRQHIVRAVAPTIEAQNRIAAMMSTQGAILSAPYNPASITADIASELHGLGYMRTTLWYHSSATQFVAAALLGRMLATNPGAETWKFKQLAGISAVALTGTQRTNLLSKSANSVEDVAGRRITFEGTMASGEWIDVIHGVDKLYSRIQELIFSAQLRSGKIPYTQQGLNQIGNIVQGALEEMTTSPGGGPGLIAKSRTLDDGTVESPAYTVTVPNIGSIDSATRETRVIPSGNPVSFEGALAGAIHLANVVGTVSP